MKCDHVPLADIATINPATPAIDPTEPVAFLPMAAVSESDATARPHETRAAASVSNGHTYFADEDVLVAKITPCFENGKIAQVRMSQRHGFGSTEFYVVRPNATHLDARYLVHLLRTKRVRLDGARRMTGSAGQRRVPRHFIEDLLIPLPPLGEQRRIAAMLDRADDIRRLHVAAGDFAERLLVSLQDRAFRAEL